MGRGIPDFTLIQSGGHMPKQFSLNGPHPFSIAKIATRNWDIAIRNKLTFLMRINQFARVTGKSFAFKIRT